MTINETSMNIISVSAENINSLYSERTCVDGGGYWQPCGIALIELTNGMLVSVECDNTSCGDFGYRKYYEVAVDGFMWYWYESNMDGEADTPLERICEILNSIHGVIGVDPVDVLDGAIDAISIVAHYNCF